MPNGQPSPRAVAVTLIGGMLFLLGAALVAVFVGGTIAGYAVAHETWLSLLYGAPIAAFGVWLFRRGKRDLDTPS